MSLPDDLEQLADLHRRGLLDDAAFRSAKERLIGMAESGPDDPPEETNLANGPTGDNQHRSVGQGLISLREAVTRFPVRLALLALVVTVAIGTPLLIRSVGDEGTGFDGLGGARSDDGEASDVEIGLPESGWSQWLGAECPVESAVNESTDLAWVGGQISEDQRRFYVSAVFEDDVLTPSANRGQEGDLSLSLYFKFWTARSDAAGFSPQYEVVVGDLFTPGTYSAQPKSLGLEGQSGGFLDPAQVTVRVDGRELGIELPRDLLSAYTTDKPSVTVETLVSRMNTGPERWGYEGIEETKCPPDSVIFGSVD